MPHPEDPQAARALSLDLHIVTPTDEDISIQEAAKLAQVSTKTLRRAIGLGQLLRRYTRGPRGLQLVFWRADMERWAESHSGDRQVSPQQQRLRAHRLRSRVDQPAGEDQRLGAERQDVLRALTGFKDELLSLSVRLNALIALVGAETPPGDEAPSGEQSKPAR